MEHQIKEKEKKNGEEDKDKVGETIKKIKRDFIIETDTKVIIYSPKNEEKTNNYNTFNIFKSIDDIFYLVYIRGKYYIVFYNLIDEKKVIDIQSNYDKIVDIKYLFDENNQRDLLFSISNNYFKLWNVNTFECLFDIKINIYYFDVRVNHLGIFKLNDNNYNIIFANKDEDMKVFDLNGNILDYNYKSKLKTDNIKDLIFIDTYYDKKLCKNYIFLLKENYTCNNLYSFDYEKGELYQDYGPMYTSDYHITINDDDENIIKVIFLINYDSIGVFNFHSGKLIYKINYEIKPFRRSRKIFYDNIYSINFWNNNYISLSYGEVFCVGIKYLRYCRRMFFDKRYHSIEIINLKEEKMKRVLRLRKDDQEIFVKKIYHPKYGDCLLTQDDCGEIKIIKIELE